MCYQHCSQNKAKVQHCTGSQEKQKVNPISAETRTAQYSTNPLPCCSGHFGPKPGLGGMDLPSSPVCSFCLCLLWFRASLTCTLSAHTQYVRHLLSMPDRLCWLYWRPALSLGQGLLVRMVARSWLLLPVLPKAHEPLRNRKWHKTKLGFVPLASSAGWAPACLILPRNGMSGSCWASWIHSSQQASQSTARW